MKRAVVALTPVRGAFWSGLRAATVGSFVVDGERMLAISVRAWVELEAGSWLPGTPESTPRGLFRDTSPEPADAVPIKGLADVSIDPHEFESFREHDVVVTVAGERVSGAPRRSPDRRQLADEGSISIERDIEDFAESELDQRLSAPAVGDIVSWTIDGAVAAEGRIDFVVAIRADFADGRRSPVATSIDTIRIHPSKRAMELVFRGLVVDWTGGAQLDRFVVAVVPVGTTSTETIALLDAGLASAAFVPAASVEDAMLGRRPAPLTEEERTMARMVAWELGPGEPSVTPEEFHEVVSELAIRPRADVLAERELDEIEWGREEWAVAEKIARLSASLSDAADASGRADALDGELDTWTRAAKPEPIGVRAPDLDAYARVTAHVEARDPAKVLREAGLTVGEFIAIEATMSERFERDPEEARRFEELLGAHREEAALAAAEDAHEVE